MTMLFAAVHESAIDAVDGSSTGTRAPWIWGAVKAPMIRRSKACKQSRQSVSISQSRLFRSRAWTWRGKVVIRRQLKRRYVLAFFQKLPSCLVGIEACASSHHWSGELQALGHTVKPDQWSDSRRIAAAMAGCGSGIG